MVKYAGTTNTSKSAKFGGAKGKLVRFKNKNNYPSTARPGLNLGSGFFYSTKLTTFLMFLLLCLSFTKVSNAMPPLLTVSGTQIKAGTCAVTLRGTNLPSMEWGVGEGPPAGGGGDIMASLDYLISTWKVNIIRLPLNEGYWNNFQYSYRQQVDDIVADCNSKNVYVILDLHLLDQNDTTQQAMPDANSTAFWNNVATRYKTNTGVLFGLYNEPFPGDFTTWSNGQGGGPGIPTLLATVRAAEAGGVTHICLEGGIDYSSNFIGIPAQADTSLVYDEHYYPAKTQANCPATLTHPVFFGEFGPLNLGDDGGNFDNTQAIPWINSRGGCGTAWAFHPTASPSLISDWTFDRTTYHGNPCFTWITGLTAQGCGVGPTAATPVPLTATPVAGSCFMLDDMEDGNLSNATNGMWFTFRWTSVSGAAVMPWAATEICGDGTPCPAISDGSAAAGGSVAGSVYAAHVTGSYSNNGPTTYAGFAIGTELSPGYSNLTNLTLISFDVKSSQAGVTLRCNAANPKISYAPVTYQGTALAGSGGGTDNQYGFNFVVPTANTWMHVTRTKIAFECGDWGANSCPPPVPRGQTTTFMTQAQALTQITSIQWETQGGPATFGYWVDNVCLPGLPCRPPRLPRLSRQRRLLPKHRRLLPR